MDSLLASYGSDEDKDNEEASEVVAPEIPRKLSLFGRLPPPKKSGNSNPNSSGPSSSPPSFSSSTSSTPSLFAKLPPPKLEAKLEPKLEIESHPSALSRPSLFGALPPPKLEPGLANPKTKKQTVAFRPPVDISVLDDEDDWEPSKKKRAKPEPSSNVGNVGGGGGLSALLPPPKHTLGVGASLGSGSTSGTSQRAAVAVDVDKAGVQNVELDVKPQVAHAKTPAAAIDNRAESSSAFQGQMQYDNSAYAVDHSSAFPPQVQYTNEPYGWAASQGAYAAPQEPYRTSHQYEEQNWQQQANAAAYTNYSIPAAAPVVPEDPLAQVLQAERRRGREDRMPAPTVVEVKQADLTGSKLREDQLRTTGIAFGPSYQPVSSSKDKPSKIHRRKHQIGSLLHDAKAREMELMERRARGSLTKAETQAKYGW